MVDETIGFGETEGAEEQAEIREMVDDLFSELEDHDFSEYNYEFIGDMAEKSSFSPSMIEKIRKLYQDTFPNLSPKQN